MSLVGFKAVAYLRRMWPAYAVLVVSLALVSLLYGRIHDSTVAHRQAQFNASVEAIRGRAELHFTYHLALLSGLRGLFAASVLVTPDEFRRYLDSLDLRTVDPNHPVARHGVRDLGFAMRVTDDAKSEHVTAMRREGFTDYSPLFLGDGPDHFPVAYLDDFLARGMVPSGWDPMGDPVRKAALELARDTGDPTATAPTPVHAVNPKDRTFGFVLYMPVYRGGATPSAVAERREKIMGFVFASFDGDELWRTIEGPTNGPARLMVFDGSEFLPNKRVYPPVGAELPSRPSEFLDGNVASGLGRLWSFLYPSRPEFDQSPERYFPLAVLWGGSLLGLGLFGLVHALVDGRHRAEQLNAELRSSEAKFRGIFDAIQDLYYRADSDGVISVISPSCQNLLGYRPEEILGRSAIDCYVHPEQRQEVMRRIEAEGKVEDVGLLLRRKDGEVIAASLTAHLVRDERGRPAGTEGILRDITARRKTEAAVRESHALYHSLVETLPLGLFRKDLQGRYTYGNRAFFTLVGCEESQVLGHCDADFLPAELAEKARHDEARVVGSGRRLEVDEDLLRPGRDRQRLRIARIPIRDDAGAIVGIQGLCRDVTEQQRLETERLRSSKLESIGLLAGGIAHDFNNILTAIVGNVALMRLGKLADPELLEQLGEVEQAALRARDLTQQLLTFAKGGAPVRKVASLANLLRESATFALRGSNVRCEFSLPADLWPAHLDVGQLNQVIHNLVLNAIQAMPEGGCLRIGAENAIPEAEAALELSPGPYVRFWVADTGSGIKPEHLAKVFDPYFTTKTHGTGLGLATAYSIVKRHEGHMTVASESGQGATFSVWLPASPQARIESAAPAVELPRGSGRVLVVDDEAPIRSLLKRTLQRLGYEPEGVADGQEALLAAQAALRQRRPYVAVILDLTIPGGVGGEETLRRLRELDGHLKAIVSSGYSTAPVMADYAAYGFDGVLAKPYQAEDLAEVLQSVLAQKTPRSDA